MKNFKTVKIKTLAIIGMLIAFASCATENIEQTEKTVEQSIEQSMEADNKILGKKENGYSYSSEYSQVFNYYKNGVKLTNPKEIESKLSIAIDIYYNELDIEISTTEAERDAVYSRNNLVKTEILSKQTVANRNMTSDKVYYHHWYGSDRKHGSGSFDYGTYRPNNLRFCNLSAGERTVVTLAFYSGRFINSTFKFGANKTLSFYNANRQIQAHTVL